MAYKTRVFFFFERLFSQSISEKENIFFFFFKSVFLGKTYSRSLDFYQTEFGRLSCTA